MGVRVRLSAMMALRCIHPSRLISRVGVARSTRRLLSTSSCSVRVLRRTLPLPPSTIQRCGGIRLVEVRAEQGTDDARARRAVSTWLFICAGITFTIVVIGGLTRLTESGLSIVEWNPIMGALPPMTEEQWIEEFEKYKKSPEFYKMRPTGFDISDFQRIFFLEWFHRLCARGLGLVWLLPLLHFARKGYIGRLGLWPRMGLLSVLGAAQGVMGWCMVSSGVEKKNFDGNDNPVRVSHYRLAMHLMLAFGLYIPMLWTAFGVRTARPILSKATGAALSGSRARMITKVATATVLVTSFWGALVAGLDAGMIFDDWPTMGGHAIPPELYRTRSSLKEYLEDDVAVQFFHRCLAYASLLIVGASYHSARSAGALVKNLPVLKAANLVAAAVFLQVTLGIITVLNASPIPLASAHQGGSVLLITALTYLTHCLRFVV